MKYNGFYFALFRGTMKKVLAEPDMVVALMETAALAILETVIAVLTEVRMAAIRNFISKVVTWTIF